MSVYQFKLPDIGEGIAEAEIVAWHVKVGDKVEEDQQLADMCRRSRCKTRKRSPGRAPAPRCG